MSEPSPSPRRDPRREASHYRHGQDREEPQRNRSSGSVEAQIQAAIRRGDFDNLPFHGKPLPPRLTHPERDWWVKQFIEREQLTGVLPPALALRVEDREFDERVDALGSAEQVREAVDDFNSRIIEARRQLQGGPPVITALRDPEETLRSWRERRRERAAAAAQTQTTPPRPRRRWWRRRG